MRAFLLLPLFLLSLSCAGPTKVREPQSEIPITTNCTAAKKSTLLIHGGVGYTANEAQKQAILEILKEVHLRMDKGDSAMNVVQLAVERMEDSGIFNAGRGGTRTSANTVELDASIMNGKDMTAGAVASLKDIKNPIRLARAVMEKTPHLLMVGEGASKFADEIGHIKVTPDYFVSQNSKSEKYQIGTVGAVALDRCGDLAAATSTGGLFGKRPGRVGDSPIIGAGTYAKNKTVAVSATGEGEKFIRASAAVRVSNILEYTHRNLTSAVGESLSLVKQLGGSGGIIAIDRKGQIVWQTASQEPMPIGYIREDGQAVFRN